MDNPQRISPERLAVVFDDPIALNAHDYSTGNPELGWIEDGRHFVSKTRPTHASGQVMLDGGIVRGFVQSNALHTCGVHNVMFRDIYLHQLRTAFSVHYDIGKFSRSYYPGAEISWQENLLFDNIRLLHDAKLQFLTVTAPVRNIRFSENCVPAPGSVVTNALAASLMNGR